MGYSRKNNYQKDCKHLVKPKTMHMEDWDANVDVLAHSYSQASFMLEIVYILWNQE